jgi:hypothetical protein
MAIVLLTRHSITGDNGYGHAMSHLGQSTTISLGILLAEALLGLNAFLLGCIIAWLSCMTQWRPCAGPASQRL